VVTLIRGVDRRCCMLTSSGLKFNALDGAAKGEGETDEEAGGSGAGCVVVFCEEKRYQQKNRGIR
jgi:hypothetical protein